MTAVGQKKFDQAKETAEKEPVEAFLLVEKVPATFKGTPLAKDAAALITKLKKEKAVTAEMAARPSLEAVQKFESALGGPARRGQADGAGVPEGQRRRCWAS